VSVRFSAEELERLRSEAERAGIPVSALLRRHALARPYARSVAMVGSNNVASNPPSTAETSSGIRVRGFSGAYTPNVSRNR